MSESIYRILDDFSQDTQKSEYKDLCLVFSEYCKYLYDDDVCVEDIGETELDDFVHFYLMDKYPKYPHLEKNSIIFLKSFFKYLKKQKLISENLIEEWKRFLSGSKG